jgi:basic amino acid/polyamine antiporter, APA family
MAEEHGLKRNLSLTDLTAFGIAAIIGAGIFSTIGNASADGGPAVALLFVFTAVACGFSAMCYAEFASNLPVSGSAYTYAYTSFGELVAWVIGWNLLMEYAIGNIAVAISWSDYFTGLLSGFGLDVPQYLTMDYLSAYRAFDSVSAALAKGAPLADLTSFERDAYQAWNTAPSIGGLKLIADVPALGITVIITWLVYIGIKETKTAANLLVLFKLLVIFAVIGVGAFYVQPENWSPFAPNGMGGVLKGVSAVFFAYIGFDAISTAAEECKNPQRDLPRAMFLALIICTVLYIVIALILTGTVNYKELAVGDPLAHVFTVLDLKFMSGIVALSAVVAMASVLLVFQMGQPRIWMTMSRDGLLPKRFAQVHPKFQTPSFSTIVTGLVVAIPALFMNLKEVTDLTSIGTLFAFVIVCGGVLYMDRHGLNKNARFKIPYVNAQWIVPGLLLAILALVYLNRPAEFAAFFTYGDWETFQHKIPMFGFIGVCFFLSYLCFVQKLSLIPVLGLLSNLYLMTELGVVNWTRFLVWSLLGLVIYFLYGFRKSKLA